MEHLILRAGPKLAVRPFKPDPDDLRDPLNELDVTDRAHEFLFESITIQSNTMLGDIFRLMDSSPLLQQFYRQDFAEELCAEARKGPLDPRVHERAPYEGIELLELHQQWRLDISTKEYSGTKQLQLHGIGHELKEDFLEVGLRRASASSGRSRSHPCVSSWCCRSE